MKNDRELNQNLINEMYYSIRIEEANNLKTGKYTDTQMINRIANIIQSILKEAEDEI